MSSSGEDDVATIAANMLRHLGDMAGARARLGDLPARLRADLERDPRNTQLLRSAAMVEAVLGNAEEALRLINRAAEITPESKNAFVGVSISGVRARVYALIGDKDRAIAEVTRLLQIPGHANVHRHKGELAFLSLRGDPRWEALLADPKNNAPLY